MTAQSDLYYENFKDWMRARIKTHRDMRYWSEDEESVAEFAWDEAWNNAEKSFEEEIKALKARIKRLEEECAWLDCIGTVTRPQHLRVMSYGSSDGQSSAAGTSGGSTDE